MDQCIVSWSLTFTSKFFCTASIPHSASMSKSRILMGIEPVTMGTAEKETNLDEWGFTTVLTKELWVAEAGEQSPSVCSICTATWRRVQGKMKYYDFDFNFDDNSLQSNSNCIYLQFFVIVVVDNRCHRQLLVFFHWVWQPQRHKWLLEGFDLLWFYYT